MTGRITMLSAESPSGFITAENGLSVHFDSRALLAYDITYLAVGQLVTFNLEGGNCPKAANVCVQRQHAAPHTVEKRQDSPRLRYMGFEQTESIRAYRFDKVSPGEETKTFIVTTDLALFMKHHVGIQNGPVLCLHLLMAELDAASAARRPPLQCSLRDQDMLAHLASQPVPGTKPRPRRMPRAAALTPHAV